jgi:hypothetical protein
MTATSQSTSASSTGSREDSKSNNKVSNNNAAQEGEDEEDDINAVYAWEELPTDALYTMEFLQPTVNDNRTSQVAHVKITEHKWKDFLHIRNNQVGKLSTIKCSDVTRRMFGHLERGTC